MPSLIIEKLCSPYQHGWRTEEYVQEFVDFCHLSSSTEGELMDLFWSGLDTELWPFIPVGDASMELEQYLDLVMRCFGSPYKVSEVDERTNASMPHHPQTITALLVPTILTPEPVSEFLPDLPEFFLESSPDSTPAHEPIPELNPACEPCPDPAQPSELSQRCT